MPDRRPKLLRELEGNPKAVSPDTLHKVLRGFGYSHRQKGSHRTYVKPGTYPLVVPYRRPHVRQFYVQRVIDRLRGELEGEHGEDKGDNDGSD